MVEPVVIIAGLIHMALVHLPFVHVHFDISRSKHIIRGEFAFTTDIQLLSKELASQFNRTTIESGYSRMPLLFTLVQSR